MISCAAVQKLERYGQLGLKRSSLDDYVQSSLKDSKRANLFALTHMDTWRECRDYICPSLAANGNVENETAAAAGLAVVPKKEVAVSESLVYAMSFATALVGEHCHRACRAATASAGAINLSAAQKAVDAVSIFDVATPAESWAACLALVDLLKDITVTMHRQRARVWTQHGGASLTQAVAHYSSTLADVLLSIATLYSLHTASASSASASDGLASVVPALSADIFSMLTANVRHLKRCVAHYPVETLFHARTLPAMVRQYVHKQQQQQQQRGGGGKETGKRGAEPSSPASDGFSAVVLAKTMGVRVEAVQQLPPLVALLLATTLTSASSATVLDGCSLFQRLGLVYSFVSLDGSSSPSSSSAVAAAPCLLDDIPIEARTQLQSALCTLLSAQACNRATRYVVYYRGDDVRLLQNNVRQPSEYAMHTFATTAPIEPSLVSTLSDFLCTTSSPTTTTTTTTTANASLRCALLVASWMASAPLFFHSFCMDSTWSVFAREQRRMTILNQMKARRERKQEKRKRKRGEDGGKDDGASVGSDDASDTASVSSHQSAASQLSRGGSPSLASLASRQTSIGLLSLASRASVLSTLSKRSQASYLSFLSVLKPDGATEGDGEGGTAEAEPKLHESADGNTNLPLILLEELVLALYSVMENYDADLLDRFRLRELAWQCVGHMLALVQGSMHHAGQATPATDEASALAAVSPIVSSIATPLFNLGYDTRYNHGLGYEVLGLLFAKVISPQLEGTVEDEEAERHDAAANKADVAKSAHSHTRKPAASDEDDDDDEGEDGHSTTASVAVTENALPAALNGSGRRQTPGRPYVCAARDPVTVQVRVEGALSQCLATYEDVAPQVVDANLSTILRIAARAAATTATTTETRSESATPHVLEAFLSNITHRLGRGNQVAVLLDALLKPDQTGSGAPQLELNTQEETMAALQRVFAQPQVHLAFVEACTQSMDPETLMSHVITYVATLTDVPDSSKENNDDDEAAALLSSPTYVLFLLQLVAALLEGVRPTSVTSAAVLERSTEMELLLSSFLVERLSPLLPVAGEDVSDEAAAAAARTWRFSSHVTPRAATRALLLHTLYALYQCRQVTRSCLQDLGTAPVGPYLEMLEETLWQCQTQVGVLAGSTLTMDTLRAMLDASSSSSHRDGEAPLQLHMDPHFDAATLLTLLVVQRLCLARSVATMLGVQAGPAGEARRMAHAVLDSLVHDDDEEEDDTNGKQDASVMRDKAIDAVRVANLLSAEGWQSLCAFGKPKRVRQRLVALLRLSFDLQAVTVSTTSPSSPSSSALPLWLSRCLRVDGGAVLRALVTFLLAMDASAVVAALSSAGEAMADCRLLIAVSALRDIYLRAGHIPYWCSLLDTVMNWLEAWYKARTRAPDAVVHTPLLTGLLLLTSDCLVLERRAAEMCRQALFELDKSETGDDVRPDQIAAAAAAAATTTTSVAQQSRTAFTAALGVPVTISTRVAPARATTGEAEDVHDEADEVDMEKQEAESLMHVVAMLFSPSSRWTRLLWQVSCETAGDVSRAAALLTPVQTTAVSLLAFTYRNALQSARLWQRAHGAKSKASSSSAPPDASRFLGFRYVHHVAAQFIARLAPHSTARVSRSQQEENEAAQAVCGRVLVQFLAWLEGTALVLPVSGRGAGGGRPSTRTPARDSTALTEVARSQQGGDDAAEKRDARPAPTTTTTTTTATTVPSASDVMAQLFQRWLVLLHDQLVAILHDPPTSQAGLSQACSWVNALYGHLLDAFLLFDKQSHALRTTIPAAAAGEKRTRDAAKGGEATAPSTSAASDAAKAFIDAVKQAGKAARLSDADAQAVMAPADLKTLLIRVLNKTEEKNGAPSLWARLTASDASEAASAAPSSRIPGLTTAWLLLKLDEVLSRTSSAGSGACGEAMVRPLQHALQCALAAAMAPAVTGTHGCEQVPTMHAWSRGVVAPCASSAVVQRLAQELRTLSQTLRVMHANAVPAALHHYMHALFNEALPASATARGLSEWLGETTTTTTTLTASEVHELHATRGHALLSTVADTLLALSAVPGMRMGPLVPVLKRVLWASTALKAPLASSVPSSRQTLWSTLLQLCALPSPALTSDNSFLDAVWWFVFQILEVRVENGAIASSSSTSPVRPAAASHVLTFEEMVLLLRLLTQVWLRVGIFWRTPALLPNLMGALFEAVMHGVETHTFPPHTILNALASFLFQLVKDVELRRRQRGNKTDGEEHNDNRLAENADSKDASAAKRARRDQTGSPGATSSSTAAHTTTLATTNNNAAVPDTKLGAQTQEQQAGAALEMASTASQYLALAAATSAMFEVAQSYVAIFTTYSNDTDYLASDLLKALSRVHLPRKIAPPIAYHTGTRIVSHGLAAHTYSDLAFTSVGSDESKALLRQAALRLEEEQEDLVDEATRAWQQTAGGKTGGAARGGHRNIFRVAE